MIPVTVAFPVFFKVAKAVVGGASAYPGAGSIKTLVKISKMNNISRMHTHLIGLNGFGKVFYGGFFKTLLVVVSVGAALSALSACSTNPATGKSQFTALMSPQQEVQIGAEEHQKIAAQFGFYNDPAVQAYVSGVGARVTKNTERPDVKYKFYVLDSPIVNAFALPGGYIYVSRGLLALANSEAELAAVLGHEAGHITGRHSAERYSQSALASIGASVVGMAVNTPGVSDALGLGANLYLSSYSRGQEREADSLGLRYMNHGGYNTDYMAAFLSSMKAQSDLDAQVEGNKKNAAMSYFSTHPATGERVADTRAQATSYPDGGVSGRETYFSAINGLVYGDSAAQGFVRGQDFIHTQMGFAFSAPQGFTLKNGATAVTATQTSSGAAMVFDMDRVSAATDPATYLSRLWLKGEQQSAKVEAITINGMKAATAGLRGSVNGRAATIQLVAIQWSADRFARFQIVMPDGISQNIVDGLKRASYSFRRLTAQEKAGYKPHRVQIVTARSGDTVSTLAARMALPDHKDARFRVLNGLGPQDTVRAGVQYKLVVE